MIAFVQKALSTFVIQFFYICREKAYIFVWQQLRLRYYFPIKPNDDWHEAFRTFVNLILNGTGKSINGGTPKYSVSLIIPKSDTKTVAKIKAAIEAAYQEGQAKLKGNGKSVPPLAAIKTPLRDGDIERPDDPAYGR